MVESLIENYHYVVKTTDYKLLNFSIISSSTFLILPRSWQCSSSIYGLLDANFCYKSIDFMFLRFFLHPFNLLFSPFIFYFKCSVFRCISSMYIAEVFCHIIILLKFDEKILHCFLLFTNKSDVLIRKK